MIRIPDFGWGPVKLRNPDFTRMIAPDPEFRAEHIAAGNDQSPRPFQS